MTSYKKQTQQLRMSNVVFLNKDNGGTLHQFGQKSTEEEIMVSEGATLIPVSKKSGEKNPASTMKKLGNHT